MSETKNSAENVLAEEALDGINGGASYDRRLSSGPAPAVSTGGYSGGTPIMQDVVGGRATPQNPFVQQGKTSGSSKGRVSKPEPC